MSSRPLSTGAKRAPTRLSTVWGRMMTDCPGQVAAYGKCIADNLDNLKRDACAPQFAAMKQCAEAALKSVRGAR